MGKYPMYVKCPHCDAKNEVWGWSEQGQCQNCHLHFKIDLDDDHDSHLQDAKEFIEGVLDDDKKIAEFVEK